MTITIIEGDVRARLEDLPAASVQCVVCSPPYYGLRDYGTGTWEGGDPLCGHIVGSIRTGEGMAKLGEKFPGGGHKASAPKPIFARATCPACGALRTDGQLGQEDSPEEFVATLVDVFRAVRRVLRDDGVLWLNLGDSYCGRGGQSPQTGGIMAGRRRGKENITLSGRTKPSDLLKTKDLVGIPWMAATALRAGWARCTRCDVERRTDLWPLHNGTRVCIDCLLKGSALKDIVQTEPGWYLRQDVIWHKPNPMPESVKDRCTKAHEYLFMLTKSEKYYFDADAIAETSIYGPNNSNQHERAKGYFEGKWSENGVAGRNEKSFKAIRETRNKRSVWTIATEPYPGDHPAVFPTELVKPCILATSRPGDMVLDCFGGVGTTMLVAKNLGRRGTMIELNGKSVAEARVRIFGPLFAEVG